MCTKDWIVITILNKLKSLKVAQIKDEMDGDVVCDGLDGGGEGSGEVECLILCCFVVLVRGCTQISLSFFGIF